MILMGATPEQIRNYERSLGPVLGLTGMTPDEVSVCAEAYARRLYVLVDHRKGRDHLSACCCGNGVHLVVGPGPLLDEIATGAIIVPDVHPRVAIRRDGTRFEVPYWGQLIRPAAAGQR